MSVANATVLCLDESRDETIFVTESPSDIYVIENIQTIMVTIFIIR